MNSEREIGNDQRFGPTASDDFGSRSTAATEERTVTVISGIYQHPMPLVGRTVAQARSELTDRLNIDPEATAFVDGQPVHDSTVLEEGQSLLFLRRAGEKGMLGSRLADLV